MNGISSGAGTPSISSSTTGCELGASTITDIVGTCDTGSRQGFDEYGDFFTIATAIGSSRYGVGGVGCEAGSSNDIGIGRGTPGIRGSACGC